MSTLVTKKGIANLASDLCQRHVLAELFDRIIKGDSEPITPSKLAATIHVSTSDIVRALQSLEQNGLVSLSSQHDWDEVGSVTIEGIAIELTIGQLAMSAQTNAGEKVAPREVSGLDQFTSGADLIRSTVLPGRNTDETLNGWFVLNIVRNPGLDGEFLLLDKEFQDQDEAWAYWDEWKAGHVGQAERDKAFLDWCRALEADPIDSFTDGDNSLASVPIGEEAFERLAQLVIFDDEARALKVEGGELVFDERGYVADPTGPTYEEPSTVESDPGDENDSRLTEFDIEVATKEGLRKVAVKWSPGVDVGNGVAMSRFEFVPAWDTDQLWKRDIVKARVPKEADEFLSFAVEVAQSHYDKHGGGQS